MKHFLINSIKFFVFSIVIYVILIFSWGTLAPDFLKPNINYPLGSYGHMYTRLSEVKDFKNVDILFLGSSHAYRGFDPRIFAQNNFKTFNLGSSAQTPIQTKVLLHRYLKTLNPNTVVYEVYPRTFMTDGVESSLDIIANDQNDKHSFNMALEVNHIKTYNALIYATIRQSLNLDKSFQEPKITDQDEYISGGFVEKEMQFFNPKRFSKKQIHFDQNQIEAFSEIIQMLEDKDIKLILVLAPITKSKYQQYTNIDSFDRKMRSFSTYYNFNKKTFLRDSLHFYDAHHLNSNGVKLFNKKLLEVLHKN